MLSERLASERGFTLVELLATMLAGSVVMLAVMAILDLTLHQTTRTYSYVSATQRARVTTETLENELHSSCIAAGETPIQSGSSDTSITFISQYGNAANVTPVLRTIAFSSAAQTLTESDYAVSGGSAPNWTFNTDPYVTRTLLTNVSQQTGGLPVFQYFAYQQPKNASGQPYTEPDGTPYMMLLDGTSLVPGTSIQPAAQPLAVPLTVANAQLAAEVMIKFKVAPESGSGINTNIADASTNVDDAVVIRLTPPANHVGSGASFLPCG
jgi:prepilin-type N-terminal cleavage/methylation domain-containing protein